MRGFKLAIGLIIGFALAFLLLVSFYFIVAQIYYDVFYTPGGLGPEYREYTFGSLLSMLIAMLSAIFLGALVASVIAKWRRLVPSIVIGTIMCGLMLISVLFSYQPLWYKIALIGLSLPSALSAQLLYNKFTSQ